MKNRIVFGALWISIAGLSLRAPALADSSQGGRWVALDAVAGLPQLVGPQFSFVRLSGFQFGYAAGWFPWINNALQRYIPSDKITVALGNGEAGNVDLYPAAAFSIFGHNIFARYFPGNGPVYLQVHHQIWTLNVNFQMDLRNEALDITQSQLIYTATDVNLYHAGLSIGWWWPIGQSLHFNAGTGIGYSYTYSISTQRLGIVSLANAESSTTATYAAAVAEGEARLSDGITQIRGLLRFVPYAYLGVGISL